MSETSEKTPAVPSDNAGEMRRELKKEMTQIAKDVLSKATAEQQKNFEKAGGFGALMELQDPRKATSKNVSDSGEKGGFFKGFLESDECKQFVKNKGDKNLSYSGKGSIFDNQSDFNLTRQEKPREYDKLYGQQFNLREIFPQTSTQANTIPVLQFGGVAGSAETQRENDDLSNLVLRPEMGQAEVQKRIYDVKTQAIIFRLPLEILEDSERAAQMFDREAREKMRQEENAQFFFGDGIGDNLTGLTHHDIEDYKWSEGVVGDLEVDLILHAILQQMTKATKPTFLACNTSDFERLLKMRDNDGNYRFVSPFTNSIGRMFIWTIPVIHAPEFTPGQMIIGDSSYAEWCVRKGLTLTSTDSHGDDFAADVVAFKLRQRATNVIHNLNAFATVSFDSAPA